MKPQTKTYKHVIDLYFESVPHSIRTFSVHGNTLINECPQVANQ